MAKGESEESNPDVNSPMDGNQQKNRPEWSPTQWQEELPHIVIAGEDGQKNTPLQT